MTTVATLIENTRNLLQGSYKAQLNQLAGAVTATATTLNFKYALQGIGAGNFLGIDDEVVYVWQAAGSAGAVVQRGMRGTTAAGHDDQTIVEASPRFPKIFIRNALKDEIASWPNTKVYGVGATTLTVGANVLSTDALGIPSNFLGIIKILKKPDTAPAVAVDNQLLDLSSSSWAEIPVRAERLMNRTDFSTGTALFFDLSRFQGMTIRVIYKTPFDTSDMNDGVSVEDDIGLSDSMVDIPPYGVAWRLLTPTEVNRSSTYAQGEARNSADVPLGGTLRSAAGFKQIRDSRLDEVAVDLLGINPWRKVAM